MPYAFYFLALILTVVHHQSPANESPAARADHVALCRVLVSSHRPSSDGTFDLTIVRNRQGLDAAYLNVVADFNGDGMIKAYGVKGEVDQSEWIIRNEPLPVGDSRRLQPAFSVWFPFPDRSIVRGSQCRVAYILTAEPITVPSMQSLDKFTPWDSDLLTLKYTGWGMNDELGQRLTTHEATPSKSGPAKDTVISSSDNGPTVPDIAQRSNECGPTSAANSLLWLAHRFGFQQMLTVSKESLPDTAQLILDLMSAMAGNTVRPFKGLTGDQMFSGIVSYVQDHRLPLGVEGGKLDPEARGPAAFDFINRHLSGQQPAELLIWMPDGSGHWVTVTGLARDQKRAILYVHDPDDKKAATAVWELSIGLNGKPDGKLSLPSRCSLGWAVSEAMVRPETSATGTGDTQLHDIVRRSGTNPSSDQSVILSIDIN